MRSCLPQFPKRQPWWMRALLGAAEILASIVLAIAATAIAFATTTSANLRLAIAIPLIVGAVYAESWLRQAVHEARHHNLSRNSQTHNLSRRELNRRFRRG